MAECGILFFSVDPSPAEPSPPAAFGGVPDPLRADGHQRQSAQQGDEGNEHVLLFPHVGLEPSE